MNTGKKVGLRYTTQHGVKDSHFDSKSAQWSCTGVPDLHFSDSIKLSRSAILEVKAAVYYQAIRHKRHGGH